MLQTGQQCSRQVSKLQTNQYYNATDRSVVITATGRLVILKTDKYCYRQVSIARDRSVIIQTGYNGYRSVILNTGFYCSRNGSIALLSIQLV